jgi:hypothetical protein
MKCLICDNELHEGKIFCSHQCYGLYRLRQIRLCKIENCGRKHYGLGYCQKHYDRARFNYSLDLKLNLKRKSKIGKKNSMWKGNNVGYVALHDWVRRRFPKPNICKQCNINKPYDLSNISNKYRRDLNDWEWLCRSCHMKGDGRIEMLHMKLRRWRNETCIS